MSATGPKSIIEVNQIMAALQQCASDRDTLAQMLRTTQLRRDILQKRLEKFTHKRIRRKKFSPRLQERIGLLQSLNGVVDLLTKALDTHRSILAAARGKRRRKTLEQILNFLRNQITKLQGSWHILELWYKDARNILASIMENATALQKIFT